MAINILGKRELQCVAVKTSLKGAKAMGVNTYNLDRFVTAQQGSYQIALSEIRDGHKRSHWMWYIFPQALGLGKSATSQYYGICDIQEAIEFLRHPILGHNLVEISEALLELDTNNAAEIFGRPDDKKLKSCMTLFALAGRTEYPVFRKVLEKFFDGRQDRATLRILGII